MFIIDTAAEAMQKRFLTRGSLYADLSLLHPKNFPLIHINYLSESALEELRKLLVVYDSRGTVTNLQIGWLRNKSK